MQHFPILLRLAGRRVVVSGAGRSAVAKLRLLLKTDAEITVFGPDPEPDILAWHRDGALRHEERRVAADDLDGAALLYCASDDPAEDARAAALARRRRIPVNVVDDLEGSDFITPAIVDRDPVTVAIGTEGTAPVLARALKAALEAQLPISLGPLARIGQAFRSRCGNVPAGRMRRALWSEYFFRRGPRGYAREGENGARAALRSLLDEAATATRPAGLVSFVGAGPGDAELLTLKARNRLHEADIVVHDRLVSAQVLELARRDAERVCAGKSGYGPSWPQVRINALLVSHARAGNHVVRLKSGDPAVFGRLDEEIEALEAAGIPWEVVPGITAAAGAAADMGVSLTRRGRNSELRLITARDVEGFAEHDWAALARPGAVAAIYMGKRAAAFLRGRLLMRGAAPSTPVTIVENASRQDRRIVATTLLRLPEALDESHLAGAVVLMFGLLPRDAVRKAEADKAARQEAV
ncbi:MAG: uroporphyrinogen-III C-methyltransferase [Boseongicola sp. SB0673_bin_14]|nr:uroporphyrinogen-III C-methyltransferase [Boseongicola sp. SB0673_bin_14]